MRLMRLVGSVSTAGVMMLAIAGTAAAADDVTLDTTGPNSTNDVQIDNNQSVTSTTTNSVLVLNVNAQAAITGDVNADHNTSVGGLASGNASNENAVTTEVTIGNEAAVTPGGGGGGGQNNGGGGGQNNAGGGGAGAGGRGAGAVLGAAVGGMGAGAVLPEVGASVPVDVSAIRAAWNPVQNSSANDLVKRTQAISQAMLLAAALLSLVGAVASAVYARRQEGRVS